jgi:flavin reductase (DIM6/NTAB) family NADH-FMN oxidoreductase RutF
MMTDVDQMTDIDDELFRAAMADLPAAVSIVTTTAADGTPRGATVSAVTSVSLRPAMLLVHVAADGQQEQVLRLAGKGADKFAGLAWSTGMSGQPQLAGATVVLDCVVTALVPGGDHTIVLGRVVGIEHDPQSTPIVYHRRRLVPAPAA